jgi:hypothetical protein
VSRHSSTRLAFCETELLLSGSKVHSSRTRHRRRRQRWRWRRQRQRWAARRRRRAQRGVYACRGPPVRCCGWPVAPEELGPIGTHTVDVLMRVEQGAAPARAEDGRLALEGEGRAQNDGEVRTVQGWGRRR